MRRCTLTDPTVIADAPNIKVAIETVFCHHVFREQHCRPRLTPSARLLTAFAAAPFLTTSLPTAQAAVGSNWEESGQASWYGPGFHGRRSSNGEVFNERALTAAHDSLPLGTRVLVTTQETGRSIVVTITDRLPPKRLRIIDLSKAAAARIGLLASGVGMVTLSSAADAEPVEVAEAPEDVEDTEFSPPLRGPRHTHHAARKASARR